MVLPRGFDAGESVEWTTGENSLYPSVIWSLRTILSSATTRYEIAGVADPGNGWTSSVEAATTAAWTPGSYEARSYVEQGTSRVLIERRTITVYPSALVSAAELRTASQIALDAVDARLQGRASRDQEEMQFNGRSIKRFSMADLLKLRGHLKHLVEVEQAERDGRSSPTTIKTRFV